MAPAEFSTGPGNSRTGRLASSAVTRPGRRSNLSRVHELSIAIDLVDLACDEMARRQLSSVLAVHVRIGSGCGVVTDALAFSFDVVAAGTPLEGAALRCEETTGCDLELRALEVADR